jgi:5-methylcytosine-specific restriction protein A
MRRQRPCLGCRRLTRNPSRCDTCQAARQQQIDQARGSTHQRGYGSTWQRTSTAAIARHREQYGNWCPGWQVPAHQDTDLTADHIVAKANGGSDDQANVQVMCRKCNARKRNQ